MSDSRQIAYLSGLKTISDLGRDIAVTGHEINCEEFSFFHCAKVANISHAAAIAPGTTTLVVLGSYDTCLISMAPLWWTTVTLTKMFISSISIGEIPHSVSALCNLQALYCPDCRIERIPGEIARLPALHTLVLTSNVLSWIPSTLARRFDLLELSWNYFHTAFGGNPPPQEIIDNTADELRVFRYEFAEAAIGLQDLELPALVTLEILDALCPNAVRMAAKWDLVVGVKHFRR
jgi:Leucine-rich repeat (LRR) protein